MNLTCLRGFPHVLRQVKALWGHPELEIYIKKLQIQDEPRDGFPPHAFAELDAILDVHRLLFAGCDKDLCRCSPAPTPFSHG